MLIIVFSGSSHERNVEVFCHWDVFQCNTILREGICTLGLGLNHSNQIGGQSFDPSRLGACIVQMETSGADSHHYNVSM